MKLPFAFVLVLFAGCASAPSSPPPLKSGEVHSIEVARNGLSIGKSTKTEVRALLGKTNEVAFESGYEVWAYRQQLKEKEKPPSRELVLLFAPSGVLTKMRLR
jgi:hypothetical protein